jgi:dihydropteroate synthase
MKLSHARGVLESSRCLVMGIVNRTPDSFYDGGRMDLDASVTHALSMVEDGAAVLDIGAVKAGPGKEVSEREEIERLLPLVESLAVATSAPLSVETSRPRVARAAIEAGACIVNDVTALADTELASVCAETGAALVLMHNGGQLRGRPRNQTYEDVSREVSDSLMEMVGNGIEAGIAREALMIDPGLDFGKNTFHSLALMRDLSVLVSTGIPVLVAASRKDVIGETLDLPVDERLEGSLALAVLAAAAGGAMVRVHDVAATVRAVTMADAVAGRVQPQNPVRGLWD